MLRSWEKEGKPANVRGRETIGDQRQPVLEAKGRKPFKKAGAIRDRAGILRERTKWGGMWVWSGQEVRP